ncbi:MAG: transcriptional regulator [Ignisphaera sp.]
MRSTYELASKYVVPAIKRRLVLELAKKGLMGVEIARKLGISQSLVTRYLSGERGSYINIDEYTDIVKLVEGLANRIIENHMSEYDVVRELDRIVMAFMVRKYLCKKHKEIEPSIDITKCNICPSLYKVEI